MRRRQRRSYQQRAGSLPHSIRRTSLGRQRNAATAISPDALRRGEAIATVHAHREWLLRPLRAARSGRAYRRSAERPAASARVRARSGSAARRSPAPVHRPARPPNHLLEHPSECSHDPGGRRRHLSTGNPPRSRCHRSRSSRRYPRCHGPLLADQPTYGHRRHRWKPSATRSGNVRCPIHQRIDGAGYDTSQSAIRSCGHGIRQTLPATRLARLSRSPPLRRGPHRST